MVLGEKMIYVSVLKKLGKCPLYPARGKYMNVDDFLTPDDSSVVNVARMLLSNLKVRSYRSIVVAAYNFVALHTKYITDKKHFGKEEWWQFPREMLTEFHSATPFSRKMFGDCEDTSFLLASLLLAMGIPKNDVRVGLSTIHAWVEVRLNGVWYVLESTADKPLKEWVTRSSVNGVYAYSPLVYVYKGWCEGKI